MYGGLKSLEDGNGALYIIQANDRPIKLRMLWFLQHLFRTFQMEAEKNKNQLYVLVADEAHWGITPDSAHDRFVNSTELARLANVVVLLVSATPANLLTKDSRILPQCLQQTLVTPAEIINPSFLKGCETTNDRQLPLAIAGHQDMNGATIHVSLGAKQCCEISFTLCMGLVTYRRSLLAETYT